MSYTSSNKQVVYIYLVMQILIWKCKMRHHNVYIRVLYCNQLKHSHVKLDQNTYKQCQNKITATSPMTISTYRSSWQCKEHELLDNICHFTVFPIDKEFVFTISVNRQKNNVSLSLRKFCIFIFSLKIPHTLQEVNEFKFWLHTKVDGGCLAL